MNKVMNVYVIGCALCLVFSPICHANNDRLNSPVDVSGEPVTKYDGYQLVWADEFDKNGLPDGTNWRFEEGYERNQELQDYKKDDSKYARVENGNLILTAYKDPHEGVNKWNKKPYHFEYSSASVTTRKKVDFKCGRVDVKAKIPMGRGVWPAIWLMPVDNEYGGWPRSGEIDVMEYVWGNTKHNQIYATVHTEDSDMKGNRIQSGITDSSTLETSYHLYSLVWKENSIDILFDNKVVFTYNKKGNSSIQWPFDQAFYLIMNVAVGGSWGGTWGIDEAIFPKKMEVEYVRYYKQLKKNESYTQNAESVLSMAKYRRCSEQAEKEQTPEKVAAMVSLRDAFYKQLGNQKQHGKYSLAEIQALLKADGTFSDLDDSRVGVSDNGNEADSGGVVTEAFNRVWFISKAFREGILNVKKNQDLWNRCQKAIVHYGGIEISRPNNWSRFHASCFAIPTAAVHIYFCHLPQMNGVEQGKLKDKLSLDACDMLKAVALQAWTQPLRGDETDDNVVQLERFRNHTWWVGGNALSYRPLLPVAFMFRSAPMVELLSEISLKCVSTTSQATYHDSFWNEGFTVDGAGWGHGKQCLIWGYPIDGTIGALGILGQLQGSLWEQKLNKENVQALMNFFRGGNYYYYNGYKIPCLDRNSMGYVAQPRAIPYHEMLKILLMNWRGSFSQQELQELELLCKETSENKIRMDGYGMYNGTRWFFNNDDLIKKDKNCHIMVNMSSSRCDGIESASGFADAYNFYTTDGITMFQRTGDEYGSIFGGFDVTAMPGITAREGMDQLVPVTNWRGYSSKHNFAAASTLGGENAVGGFIFEKMNASERENVNDRADNVGKNKVLYGVKAYKSYFMLGDYFVALGAGITNLQPEQSGHIRTTIDQTAHTDSVSIFKGIGIDWIIQQRGFAYSVFPEYKDKIQYVCEKKETDWLKMNQANRTKSNLPKNVDIFRIWLDHGRTPVNDTYGYAVYTGKGDPAAAYPFQVLRNDTLVQAVQSLDRQTTEAVFYQPGALKTTEMDLSVSAPCTVLMEGKGEICTIVVTDAEMDKDRKEIVVTYNGKTIPVAMPQGKFCGKPAVVSVGKK